MLEVFLDETQHRLGTFKLVHILIHIPQFCPLHTRQGLPIEIVFVQSPKNATALILLPSRARLLISTHAPQFLFFVHLQHLNEACFLLDALIPGIHQSIWPLLP